MLEVIIERGCHLLQTHLGERLPRVVETMIGQKLAEPGNCQFIIIVNEPGACRYDPIEKKLVTPKGYHLRKVEVLQFKPAESALIPAKARCQCRVSFHYETKHKPEPARVVAN